MGRALLDAAHEAGIRITLLDTVYLTSTVDGAAAGRAAAPLRRRPSMAAWAQRAFALTDSDTVRIGMAAHSVRAVPAGALAELAELAGDRPLHVHLSEQPAENEACRARYGLSPTELLHSSGLLGAYDHGGARHPPLRRRPGAARRHRYRRVLLPHHRAGPGRRDRAGARHWSTPAARCAWAATRTR